MIDRDVIIEWIDSHRKNLAVVVLSILLFLIFGISALLFTVKEDKKKTDKKVSELQIHALQREEVWLPTEPLPVPGIQYFRESRTRWSAEEAKQWYTTPDAASLEELRSVSRNQIDTLLESVP